MSTDLNFDESEIEEFKVETEELLDTGEEALIASESGKDFNSQYDSIFRTFHSIKGAAGMIGIDPLQSLMHNLENNLTTCKGVGITKEQATYFLNGIDAARKILHGETAEFDETFPTETSSAAGSSPAPSPSTQTSAQPTPSPSTQSSAEPASRASPPKPSKDQKGLIYIVDDESQILDILQEITTEAGFSCETYEDGNVMLEALKTRRPDVVLTDMKMPTISGLDLLKEIRKSDPDLPVVFLSAYLTIDILSDAIAHGVHSALKKPCDEVEMLNVLNSAYKRSQITKLLNKSINLIMYQFSDLVEFLEKEGKTDIANSLNSEIKDMLVLRKKIRTLI